MRKRYRAVAITTLISGVLLSYSAWAGDVHPEIHSKIVSICQMEAETAMTLMRCRQDGVPMSDVLVKSPNTPVDKWYNAVIKVVYSKPRHYTDSSIERAVSDIGDSVFQSCYSRLISDFKRD
jgi:hypothetical protein